MSYTPHTWIDGETITAAKMNAIEEGIEEAASSGGGGLPWVHVTTNTGNTMDFGAFAIATLNNGVYSLVTAAWSWPMLMSAPGLSDFYVNCQCPMPSASDLYLVFADYSGATVTTSGAATGPVSIDLYGEPGTGYVITGDFSIDFDFE